MKGLFFYILTITLLVSCQTSKEAFKTSDKTTNLSEVAVLSVQEETSVTIDTLSRSETTSKVTDDEYEESITETITEVTHPDGTTEKTTERNTKRKGKKTADETSTIIQNTETLVLSRSNDIDNSTTLSRQKNATETKKSVSATNNHYMEWIVSVIVLIVIGTLYIHKKK